LLTICATIGAEASAMARIGEPAPSAFTPTRGSVTLTPGGQFQYWY
jgi:hypothetical protein